MSPAGKIAAIVAGAMLVGTGMLFVAQSWNASATGLLQPDNEVLVSTGAAVYAEHCASCHGVKLEGQPNWRRPGANGRLPAPPHDETGHTWHHADTLLFDLTKYGAAKAAGLENYESDMPTYEDVLTDTEIIAVLSFIKSRWSSELQKQHDSLNRR